MMKKVYATLAMLFLTAAGLFAQTGSVRGTVADDVTGEPLVGATIAVEGSSRGAMSNADGQFVIDGLLPGSYEVSASYIGYRGISQTVEILSGKTAEIRFAMEGGVLYGEAVVISGSRKPEKITESPATIETISSLEIEEYAGNPGELLARQKGVDYIRAGIAGPGLNIRGFNSNFNSKNLQVTDGRFSTLIATGLPMGPLNTTIKEDIQQVEVILGPNATLYGPNAHNGLLNIITKDPRNSAGTTIVLNPGVSGDGDLFYSGRIRHAQVLSDKFAFKVMAEYTKANEFDWDDSVYIDRVGAFDSLGKAIPDGIKEGYTELELDEDVDFLRTEAGLYFTPKEGTDIIFNWGRSNSNYLAPTNVGRNQIKDWSINYYQLRLNTEHFFAQVYFTQSSTDSTYAIDERTKQYYRLLDAGYSDAEARGPLSYGSGALFQDDSRRWNGELQYNNQFGSLNLVAGVQGQYDQANSLGTYLLDENADDYINIFQIGGYAHLTYDFGGGFRALAAARADYHQIYEFNLVPKLALLKVGKNGTFRLTYGQGIAAPTILNMYGNLFSGLILGNAEGFTLADGSKVPIQTVEKIKTIEAGYRGLIKEKLVIDANAYYNISTDFLSPVTVVGVTTHRGNTPIEEVQSGYAAYGGLVATYINFGLVNTYGADFGATLYITKELSANLNYSYFNWAVDETNMENDFDGNGVVNFLDILVNAPNHKAGFGVTYSGKKFFANTYVRWVQQYDYFSSYQIASQTHEGLTYRGTPIVEDARSTDTYNYGPLGGFVTMDLGVGYRVNDMFTVAASASNLFNQDLREFTATAPTRGLYTLELRVNLPAIEGK